MKKSSLAALISLALLVSSSFSIAKERRGAEVMVTKQDGTQVSGELIAVKKDSLLLLAEGPLAGTDLSIALAEINTVKIIKKSKAGSGFCYGLLIGAVGGAAWVFSEGGQSNGEAFFTTRSQATLVGAIGFGCMGMILGAIVGGLAGTDMTISIGEKSEIKLQPVRERLVQLARIKEIQ